MIFKNFSQQNPYLENGRLSDVIAAITTLGTYKFYKLNIDEWVDRITGSKNNIEHWNNLFNQHPEFFRLTENGKKASMVWRRQFPRNYNVDDDSETSPDHEFSDHSGSRISRRPLSPTEVSALIDVAIKLHDRVLEQKKARTWWLPLATAILSLIGAAIGSALSS